MAFGITGRLEGMEALFRRLKRLKQGARNRILRRALPAGTVGLLKLAKQLAPVDDGQTGVPGLYRKSIGRKVSTEGGGVVVRIGARTGFKAVIRTRVRGKLAGQPVYQDPANIGHLVELGHAGPSPAPPHPHLRPAWDQGQAQAKEIIAREIVAGIERELAKG